MRLKPKGPTPPGENRVRALEYSNRGSYMATSYGPGYEARLRGPFTEAVPVGFVRFLVWGVQNNKIVVRASDDLYSWYTYGASLPEQSSWAAVHLVRQYIGRHVVVDAYAGNLLPAIWPCEAPITSIYLCSYNAPARDLTALIKPSTGRTYLPPDFRDVIIPPRAYTGGEMSPVTYPVVYVPDPPPGGLACNDVNFASLEGPYCVAEIVRVFDDGTVDRYTPQLLVGIVHWLHYAPMLRRTSPTTLVGVFAAGPLVAPSQYNGPQRLMHSLDNGFTWAYEDPAWFANHPDINTPRGVSTFQALRLNTNSVLYLAYADISALYSYRFVYKLYVDNVLVGADILTMGQYTQGFVVNGAPVLFFFDMYDPGGPPVYTKAQMIVGSADGLTWGVLTDLPWEDVDCGVVTALDEKTLGLPVYEADPLTPGFGDIALYVTTDNGATWKRRSTLAAGVPDTLKPSTGSFSRVHEIRTRGGDYANPMPSQPWVCDDRILPPWAPV